MKDTPLTKAADEIIKLKMQAADDFIEEYIEPLSKVGDPESLLGKKYEDWTPQDLSLLQNVYVGEDTPLTRLIFRKSYTEVQELEREV